MDACACVHAWSDEDMKSPVLSLSPLFSRDRIYQWTGHLSLRAPLVASMPRWPCCLRIPASPWSSPRMAFRSSCLRYQTLTHWTIVPALSMDDFWGRFNTISGRIWLSENGRCNCHNYTLKRKGSDQQRGPPYLWSVRDHVWLHRSCPLQLWKSIGPFEVNTQSCSWFLR